MSCLLGYSSMISRRGVADDCLLGTSLSGCGLLDGDPPYDILRMVPQLLCCWQTTSARLTNSKAGA